MSATIDQLRRDIQSAQTDLVRIETQQSSAQEELTTLEAEVKELGFAPTTDLQAEAQRILDDVQAALTGVQEEVKGVEQRTDGGD